MSSACGLYRPLIPQLGPSVAFEGMAYVPGPGISPFFSILLLPDVPNLPIAYTAPVVLGLTLGEYAPGPGIAVLTARSLLLLDPTFVPFGASAPFVS